MAHARRTLFIANLAAAIPGAACLPAVLPIGPVAAAPANWSAPAAPGPQAIAIAAATVPVPAPAPLATLARGPTLHPALAGAARRRATWAAEAVRQTSPAPRAPPSASAAVSAWAFQRLPASPPADCFRPPPPALEAADSPSPDRAARRSPFRARLAETAAPD